MTVEDSRLDDGLPAGFLHSMNQFSASQRTTALLVIVVIASRGLSFSRGNLSDIGVICFAFVLAGLPAVLLLGERWRGSSDTVGGFPTWQVALPCALIYVFATNAGRHLLVFASEDWRPALRVISGSALVLALPVLLFVSRPLRDRLSENWQIILVTLPLVPALVLFLLVPLASPSPIIDVFLFQTQAARALLFGLNPYDITFTNVYGGAELYPSGSPDSYPYPPLSLLFASISHVLGDIRWALIACHVAAATLLFATARQRLLPMTEAIILTALFFWLPHAPFVSEQAWTDPSVALGLGLVSFFLARRQPMAALWAAGFAVALKQTMVVLLPLVWGLWRRLGRSQLIAVFSLSAVTYGVFLLWDAAALWNDVVTFHMLTPFRPGSMTLSAYLVHFFEFSPLPSWLSLVGLLVGMSTAIYAQQPADSDASPCDSRRVWRFFAGMAFALLLTLVLSKHAFMNYFYLVQYCLIAALLWSRVADHEATT
jgi:hypothetical protein